MKYDVCAGGIFYRMNPSGLPEYLIAKKVNGKKIWHFPRGHFDSKDEFVEVTAIREGREETGLEGLIIPGFEHTEVLRINQETAKICHYFLLYVKGGSEQPQKGEITALSWGDLNYCLATLSNDWEKKMITKIDKQFRKEIKR